MARWQDPPRQREDVESTTRDGQDLRTRLLVGDDRTVSCSQVVGQDWLCEEIPMTDVQGVDGAARAAATRLADLDADTTSTSIAGESGWCRSAGDGTQRVELCLSDDGIPLTVRNGNATVKLVEFRRAVPEDAFDPPGRVT